MSVNIGVLLLSSENINGERLDIEDNVGEAIHVHYKNIRFDYSVRDFLGFSAACKEAKTALEASPKGNLFSSMPERYDIDSDYYKEIRNEQLHLLGVAELPLAELFVSNYQNGKLKVLPLEESLIYRAINNDARSLYDSYMSKLKSEFGICKYSWKKAETLVENIKRNGYKNDCLIVVRKAEIISEGKPSITINLIVDGQHRASSLLHLYGNKKIKLALYGPPVTVNA
jgi:hypothetical protein|tara:strand:+ start:1223 stop:1906 length:684 start_codon:yes stop_codon:yes gene_type:complete